MSDILKFDPVWGYSVTLTLLSAGSTLLLIFEWRKKARNRILRLIALSLMLLAVSGIATQPATRHETSQQVILLTEGYNRARVDSLLQSHPTLSLCHIQGVPPYRSSIGISPNELSSFKNEIAWIVGFGLRSAERDVLRGTAFRYLEPDLPEGILHLNLPGEISAGQTAEIEGIVRSARQGRLRLLGPGGMEDSIQTSAGERSFRLRFLPKEAGDYLYTVLLDDDTVGKVPVHVREQRQLNIAFVLHYPSFETRQLKTFLEKRHQLLLRYEVSDRRFRFEHINRDAQTFNQLTRNALDGFDLVIIDSDALYRLSAEEFAALSDANRAGIGVIALFNNTPSSDNRRLSDLFGGIFMGGMKDTVRIAVNSQSRTLPALPVRLQREGPVSDLVRSGSRTVAGYVPRDFGRTGFQLLQGTYRLALSGDSLAYASIWTPLIDEVAAPERATERVLVETPFPLYQDHPVDFSIISTEQPRADYNGSTLPLTENLFIDGVWHGKIWMDRPGWQKLNVGGTNRALFVAEPGEWKTLDYANRIRETSALSSSTQPESETSWEYRRFPLSIFFIVFLVSGAILWLTPKL